MQIYKAYKFRMYPEPKQQEKLNAFLGTKRFIYNYYLDKKIKNNKLNISDMKKDLLLLQDEISWLKEIDSCILRTALEDLEKAYQNYYKKLKGYPKFKNYHTKQSYRTNCIRSLYKEQNYQNIKIDLKIKQLNFQN